MNYLSLVLRNLTRNKRRTILTMLSITVSVFIFASLISLPGLLNQVLRDRANSLRLICHSKASLLYMLPESYRRRIETLPHVQAVAAYSVFLATYQDPNQQLGVLAVDDDHIRDIFPDWDVSAETEHEFESMRTAALVATNLMKVYRWKVGQTIMLRGTMYPVDLQLTIVGVLNEDAAGPRIIFRRDYMEELLGRPGTANLFWVKVDSSKSSPEVIAAIDEMFANSQYETATETEVALIKNQIGSNLSLMLNGAKFLAAIVMFTIALVAANTAAMGVRERRHEMAVMRAIGFTRNSIILRILVEGLIVGVTGGALGCVLALLGFDLLPRVSGALGPLALAMTLEPRMVVYSFLIAALIGAASGFIPATLATRGDISTELRAV
ncbi:MAG TPA: ABC transporter permease [Candidatus Binatus sp.]|uniref:ABC transporter permease n=1 Tax=Candidatus Binatus sp. TaxID=2811406 RepID=UPI002B4955DC|nr:ABC transporter permease [Candidatus Binatus sp.]HKN13038.1 ABC transporter permease [Candidatus Binatus sp.]